MSKTWKERLINVLTGIAIGILILIGSTQISFRYTRDYVNKTMDEKIIKHDSVLIEKVKDGLMPYFTRTFTQQDSIIMYLRGTN